MLLEPRNYYKPFDYPWAYDYYKKQNQSHWMPGEVTLGDDISDYQKLDEDSQKLISSIFRFFTQADSDVAGGYAEHYLPRFKPPEVRMMLLSFGNMEAVHQDAYSLLIENLGLPEDEYQMFMKYKSMVDKHEYLSDFGTETIEDLATTMAVFSGFTEGVQLFSSFAILMNFPRHNLMKVMGQIIAWSIRDETMHVEGMTKLFRALIEENPGVWDDTLKYRIYSAAERVIELEDSFIDTVFESVNVPNLTPEDVKGYIRYTADRRLLNLGFKGIFNQSTNNVSHWLNPMISGVEHANFFETRATEYSKASTQGNWDDIFKNPTQK